MQQQGVDVGAVVVPSEDERARDSFLQYIDVDHVALVQTLANTHPKLTNGERSFLDSMARQVISHFRWMRDKHGDRSSCIDP